MVEIREYFGRDGRNFFGDWFDRLNSEAARKVTAALYASAWETSHASRVWAAGCLNAASILGRVTEFTSAKTVSRSYFCCAAG